ncbi:hypothetical protein LCGC14_2105850, partial [marine sediment metagenome]
MIMLGRRVSWFGGNNLGRFSFFRLFLHNSYDCLGIYSVQSGEWLIPFDASGPFGISINTDAQEIDQIPHFLNLII